MATNTAYGTAPTGQNAADMGLPLADTPRGGLEFGSLAQEHYGMGPKADATQQFAGMGPLLEDDDQTVYKTLHELVLRQEQLARNHLAKDEHWTRVKLGYGLYSRLQKIDNKDQYRVSLAPGTAGMRMQAIPNQAWDLINKCAATLTADEPKPRAHPLNDTEQAEQAAEMAERFLEENGSANNLNRAALYHAAIEASATKASAYLHYWVDPSAGGWRPLQIQAHPLAQDANNPHVGPDGNPTPDEILRYVTPHMQFTDDPSQAAPEWVPMMRADLGGREHIRVFPETARVEHADLVIWLWYSTIGEGKRRWPDTVGKLAEEDVSALCDWTPERYLNLLPAALRSRWKLMSGDPKARNGTGDQRLFFYYVAYQRPDHDTPKGAHIVSSGAFDSGYTIHKDTWAIRFPREGGGTDERCIDIPVVQVTLAPDVDERDPSGRALIERFAGGCEADQTLMVGYLEALDTTLHIEKYVIGTSTVQGFQVDASRATGEAIPLSNPNDKIEYGQVPPVPANLLEVSQDVRERNESAAAMPRPIIGQSRQEKSGKAIALATQQAQIGLTQMNRAVQAVYARGFTIEVQLFQKYYTVPQMIRYVGDDGQYKVAEFRNVDFALVGDVDIAEGTGTLMTPDQRVEWVNTLKQSGSLGDEEANDAIRPLLVDQLGLPDNPHEQRIERSITLWLKGPPTPAWEQEAAQHFAAVDQAKAQAQAQEQAAQREAQAQPVAQQQAQVSHDHSEQRKTAEHAHALGMAAAEQAHTHALALKASEASHAQAGKAHEIALTPPAPVPPPVEAEPVDLTPITTAIDSVLQKVAAMETASQAPKEPAAPIVVQVQQPDLEKMTAALDRLSTAERTLTVHVPKQEAPKVQVSVPQQEPPHVTVNIPKADAPHPAPAPKIDVHVPVAPAPRRTTKTITTQLPGGRTATSTVTEEEVE